MIDTHSHIDFEEYQNNFDLFVDNLKEKEIEKVIIPGVEPSTFARITDLCAKYEMLYGAIGVHPSEYKSWNDSTEKTIYDLTTDKNIVAIGEIGLDYHFEPETKAEQIELLEKQLDIAQKTGLPVLIHDREAHEDCFNIIKNYNLKDVVFHCFSGNKDFAKKCIDEGYYIATGGVVTFKNAKDLKEAIKYTPTDRLLLETDAPYLAPVPFRGKTNSPEYLIYVAMEIAKLKDITVEEVKHKTTENAKRIFNF